MGFPEVIRPSEGPRRRDSSDKIEISIENQIHLYNHIGFNSSPSPSSKQNNESFCSKVSNLTYNRKLKLINSNISNNPVHHPHQHRRPRRCDQASLQILHNFHHNKRVLLTCSLTYVALVVALCCVQTSGANALWLPFSITNPFDGSMMRRLTSASSARQAGSDVTQQSDAGAVASPSIHLPQQDHQGQALQEVAIDGTAPLDAQGHASLQPVVAPGAGSFGIGYGSSILEMAGIRPSSIASILNTVGDTGFRYFNIQDQCRNRAACDLGFMLYKKLSFMHNWLIRTSVRSLTDMNNPYTQSWMEGMMGRNCTTVYASCRQSPLEGLMNLAILQQLAGQTTAAVAS